MSYDPEIFLHHYWYDASKRLKYSSEVLYDKLSELYAHDNKVENILDLRFNQLAVFQSYMMLIGFSLENLVKAVSIKKYISEGKQIIDFKDLQQNVWKTKAGHNIYEIAKNCSFHLTDEEMDLLSRYSEFTVWAGRYHIPISSSTYENAFNNSRLRRKPGDHVLIENIFKKAKTQLDENGG